MIKLKLTKRKLLASKNLFGERLVNVTEIHHDAAVAHALVRSMNDLEAIKSDTERGRNVDAAIRMIRTSAAEILRTDFGIEESP